MCDDGWKCACSQCRSHSATSSWCVSWTTKIIPCLKVISRFALSNVINYVDFFGAWRVRWGVESLSLGYSSLIFLRKASGNEEIDPLTSDIMQA